MEKKAKMTNSDQQYSTMAKGKTGQNRQRVISNTAQWPKGKTHCAVLLINLCLFCPFFSLAIVLFC
jgi:hypothetical protein